MALYIMLLLSLSSAVFHSYCNFFVLHPINGILKFSSSLKGKSGILKSKPSREDYLMNATDKRIVFHYTPKHASWMDQIEIWFGILMRKVIKRGNFLSQDDLKKKILEFMVYFNNTMVRLFKWTYQGKALTA